MLNYLGFVSVTTFADNQPNETARVGELSKLGRSFSRDVKVYPDPTRPEILVNMFSGYSESPDSYVEPTAEQLAEMREIARWVINQGSLSLAPSDLPSYIDSLTGTFAEWAGTFSVGNLVEMGAGWYTSSVTYTVEGLSWRLWFADTEFQYQYDEYHVETVFPVDDIDVLHSDYITVIGELEKSSSTTMLSKIMQIEKTTPATLNKGSDYTWHALTDFNTTLPISFAVVIYGKGGDNVDVIRETLVRDILAASRYDRSQWAKILPELFSPNEMVFIPFWGSVMESYDPLEDDIYLSVTRPDDIKELAVRFTPNFSPGHIEGNVNLVPTLWRGIVMSATPHEPADDTFSPQFMQMYPDYMLAETTSPDFHRMGEDTRKMSQIIYYLLTYAEKYNDYFVLPEGYSKTVRNEKEYITTSFNGYLYHIMTKRSYVESTQPFPS